MRPTRALLALLTTLAAALALVVAAPGNALAQPPEDGWQVEVTPYLWLASLDGRIGARGLPPVSVEAGFADIVKNLDFGAAATVDVRKGPWGFLIDGTYLKISADSTLPGPVSSRVDVTSETVLGQVALTYRLLAPNPTMPAALDVLAGARGWYLANELNVRPGGPLPGREFNAERGWVDSVVGLRLRVNFTERLFMSLYGDIGGFGASSDFTFQVWAGLGYQISDRFSMKLGYRYLDVDYRSGGFVFDVAQRGLLLGLGIKF